MLICKIFLRKVIHEVTSIITFDCHDNYSDIQQNSRCEVRSAQKTKNARGARKIAFAAIFISQIICWMFCLKEKQTTVCNIIRCMKTQKGARDGNVICFCFLVKHSANELWRKNCANAIGRASRAFCIFEHLPRWTWNLAVYLNNYHWVRTW